MRHIILAALAVVFLASVANARCHRRPLAGRLRAVVASRPILRAVVAPVKAAAAPVRAAPKCAGGVCR